jgi:hypothetical protein
MHRNCSSFSANHFNASLVFASRDHLIWRTKQINRRFSFIISFFHLKRNMDSFDSCKCQQRRMRQRWSSS